MAEIPVERKSVVPWWLWLVGLLLVIAVSWAWFGRNDRDPVAAASTSEEAVVAPANSAADVPTQVSSSPAASAPATNSVAPGAAFTDPGIYAATANKFSLADREAAFTGAKVVRIVGPKTFTVAAGGEELLVMIDQDLSSGAGSQGKVVIGVSVDLKGTFQQLQPEAVIDISNRRFRALTKPERETLGNTPVYLHVAEVGRLS